MTKRIKSPAHLERVKQLPCRVCQAQPCDAHHIRTPGLTGAGQRAGDFLAIPLCKEHHQGNTGIHALSRRQWEAIFGAQIEHVEATLFALYGK